MNTTGMTPTEIENEIRSLRYRAAQAVADMDRKYEEIRSLAAKRDDLLEQAHHLTVLLAES